MNENATAKAPAKVAEKDYTKMNLWQKFSEVRKEMPTIVKKLYSDKVKYKFAKIADVYEALGPAMAKVGIDWAIVSETATKKDENGDPIFYIPMTQQTQNGQRTVWIYDAALQLRWINVDNPAETEQVLLHAVGTNDGGPDKAKGAAWTYCLKYYLFEKFNIDMSEDDPDAKDLSAESTAPAKPAGPSEAQIKRLYAMGRALGYNKDAVDKRVLEKYGCKATEMTRKQYDEITGNMDAAIAKKKEKEGANE